ncbi:MAG: tRNA guanosine(34) transglycosylase Tgt [Spirochaetaceae bacterium]|nr:tRNA guanosine(34) transglycosylase Tgt [Spirochaetaceae bacterium]
MFRIEKTSGKARTGTMTLPHGLVSTPAFMPVGTNGTVKALTPEDLAEIGFDILLSNTYHLYLRPGAELIAQAGGLHRFMHWNKNILTDSGGFQVFSLAPFRKIREEGVEFRSHIDGSSHTLTPENVVSLQSKFNSDILMQLDVCSPWETPYNRAEEAVRLTGYWLEKSKQTWREKVSEGYEGKLFAIVQGNFYPDLRRRSAELALAADTPGIAVGGLSVGEPPEVFAEFMNYTASLLPPEKPRYVMGIGTPQYILGALAGGIDMFDCVLPTRTGRIGHAFTRDGLIALKKNEYRLDFSPIDSECGCKVCRNYSRAYLRHLFRAQEILSSILLSYHNLFFLQDLVKQARQAIQEDRFSVFSQTFLQRYTQGG